MTVAGVLLAAGSGSRFDGPTHKLLADIDGRPVVAHAMAALVAAYHESCFAELVIVSGAVDIADIVGDDFTVIHNPRWREGQATSLAAAIDHCRSVGHDALVVGLADQPGVSAAAWCSLAGTEAAVAVATYGGRRGNPVRLESSVWEMIPRTGDEGARPLFREHPELVTPIACDGRADDIDTVEDLQRWS